MSEVRERGDSVGKYANTVSHPRQKIFKKQRVNQVREWPSDTETLSLS